MTITDHTADVAALVRKPQTVPLVEKRLIVVHRISLASLRVPDTGLGWEAVANAYGPGAVWAGVTGGRCPYHYLVRVDGQVEQLLPALAVGAHAAGLNRQSIAVAVVGEKEPASPAQFNAAVAVVRRLVSDLLLGAEDVVGHCSPVIDHLHGPASKAWPSKVCPEPGISVAEIRARLDPAT